jgi:hypothetical protein
MRGRRRPAPRRERQKRRRCRSTLRRRRYPPLRRGANRSIADERIEQVREQRIGNALKNAQLAGELVPLVEAERRVSEVGRAARERMHAWLRSVAERFAAEKDVRTIMALGEEGIDQVFAELADAAVRGEFAGTTKRLTPARWPSSRRSRPTNDLTCSTLRPTLRRHAEVLQRTRSGSTGRWRRAAAAAADERVGMGGALPALPRRRRLSGPVEARPRPSWSRSWTRSPHDPCEEVAIIKCAQSGGSASAENWIGFISDLRPGPMLFVQATLQAAWDWAAEKFWPMVEASPRLNPDARRDDQGARPPDGDGSNKKKIKFARSNGYVLLAGANSAAGLRQRTVRYAIEDDLDQWPDDLDGQGSPEEMVSQRLKVWRRQGLSKRLKISTPTIEGASKIEAAYKASDRRRFYLKCPGCGSRFCPNGRTSAGPTASPRRRIWPRRCCGTGSSSIGRRRHEAARRVAVGRDRRREAAAAHDRGGVPGWRARMPASRKRGFHLTGSSRRSRPGPTWRCSSSPRRATSTSSRPGPTWCWAGCSKLNREVPDGEKLKELKEEDWGVGQMPRPGRHDARRRRPGRRALSRAGRMGPERRDLAARRAVHSRRDRRQDGRARGPRSTRIRSAA